MRVSWPSGLIMVVVLRDINSQNKLLEVAAYITLRSHSLISLNYIWYDDRYLYNILFSTIPTLGLDLQVKVTNFSISVIAGLDLLITLLNISKFTFAQCVKLLSQRLRHFYKEVSYFITSWHTCNVIVCY